MALIENRSSDSMDPLQHHSLLSMFHRTFKDAPVVSDSNNLDSIHSFLKTMDTKSSIKLFGEAKEILEVNSEDLGSKLAPVGVGASENNAEAVSKGNENPKERRPAMGRKRARFSLKPDKGPPSVSLEPSLDIDQLQDPEEFFSAYHKLEYAKREMERQTGGNILGENDYNTAANQRGRRPSIFRKSVSYKHNYTSAILEDDDTIIGSQEKTQQDISSPSKFVSQQPSDHSVKLQKKDLAGSVSNSEDTAGGLLDELLSTNIENLDGDGALSLLQSRLQIKPVDLDKYLHDFSEGGNVDSMDLEEEMPAIRKPMSDIQNLMKGFSEKNPGNSKKVTENLNHSQTVASPSEKPSAALSLLEKANSVSKPYHLAFSAADLDMSPAGSPTYENLNRQSVNLSTSNELVIPGKSKSYGDDEAQSSASATMGSKQKMPGVDCSKKSSSFDTSSIHIETVTKESHDGLVETIEGNHVVDILKGATSTQLDASVDKSTTENLKLGEFQLGQEEPIVAEDNVIGGHTTNAESSLEQQKKEHPKIPPKDKKKEGRARGLKERKALSRRQSLAAAGTCWDAGVRRSNRIRVRPLEYWKGERFLYGRVHESLTTVVGVKCISSPSPGAKEPKFRVTSYVSDDHKNVVEFAALH